MRPCAFGTEHAWRRVAPVCGTSPYVPRRDIPPRRTTMHIRKSMLAVAVLLGAGLSAQAWAQDQTEAGPGDNNASNSEDNSTGADRDNAGSAAGLGLSNASAKDRKSTRLNSSHV